MAKMNGRTVTEREVRAEIDLFRMERDKAIGRLGQRELFKNFKILPDLNAVYQTGLHEFAEGNFAEAMQKLQQARKWLRGNLRVYAKNSIEGFFVPQILELIHLGLDKDLLDGIEKAKKDFEMALGFIQIGASGAVEDASRAYWKLLEMIEEAPRTQRSREEHRERLAEEERSRKQREKIIAKKAKDEAEAEKSRARQKALQSQGEAERRALVEEFLAEA